MREDTLGFGAWGACPHFCLSKPVQWLLIWAMGLRYSHMTLIITPLGSGDFTDIFRSSLSSNTSMVAPF